MVVQTCFSISLPRGSGCFPRLADWSIMAAGKQLGDVIEGQLFYGVKTGLNEAFIIDQTTRDRLVKDDPTCAAIIKSVLRGEDLRPWYQENEGRWLICIPNGWTIDSFPDLEPVETQAWEKFAALHPV